MTRMIKHKDKLYELVDAGPWRGAVEADVPESPPLHRWRGEKMPLALVRQITAFFEWSLKETSSETVVHLFYNEDTGEWKAAVLPQKGHTGMSVSLLADHPGRVEAIEALGQGFDLAGTWHHHCRSGAFQSGTDRRDEEDVFGLHVTVGHVGSQQYDIDARCSFRKEFTQAVLSDWIDMAHLEAMNLPPKVADPLLRHLVCQPCPDTPFPEAWKANVIKVVYQPHQINMGGSKPPWGGYGQHYLGDDDSTHKQSAGTQKRLPPASCWMEDDLEAICHTHSLEPSHLADLIVAQYQPDQLLLDLAEVMASYRCTAEDVVEELRDMHKEKLLEQ